MNRDEQEACEIVLSTLSAIAGEIGLPVEWRRGHLRMPCRVDVSTGQPGDMAAVRVRLSRWPMAGENAIMPEHHMIIVTSGLIDHGADAAIREFAMQVKRLHMREEALQAAGYALDDAPLWSYDMDDVVRRLVTAEVGGTLDIRKKEAVRGLTGSICYEVIKSAPSQTDMRLYGKGERLITTPAVTLAFWNVSSESLMLDEDRRRLSIRGDVLPEMLKQWINAENPPLSSVLGVPALAGCASVVEHVEHRGGWTMMNYQADIVPAAPTPAGETTPWRI